MSMLLIMVVPLPLVILDLLLALSIAIGVLILFVALFTESSLEFSSFPSVLLIATIFRLSLNVASTRLILLEGHQGAGAAGSIINSFGEFVVGGNQIVGIIIFLILVIINFVVITKGTGRIAEVAARFTLDAMPGKQMAIDADLNAGLIDEDEARKRRSTIQRESDYFGALDGASKFVRGDTIAGLIITSINILGGLLVGVTQFDMTPGDAFNSYATLTIGDGLVSQIPALIISVAAGIAVTKASGENKISVDLQNQIFSNVQALYVVSAVLITFSLIPGLPVVPFMFLAITTFTLAQMSKRSNVQLAEVKHQDEQARLQKEISEEPEDIESLLPIDILGLELGYGMIPLVDEEQDGELLKRIKAIRRQIALDFGYIVPPLHIKDNLELSPGEYSITIKGIEIARNELMMGHHLAMKTGDVDEEIPGVDTVEPAFGLPAIWIAEEDEERAQFAGYTVVDLPTVLATHLTEILKNHAFEFIGRQETQKLIDSHAESEPKVVEELIPSLLSLGVVQKVLQNLLKELVSIRDLHTILETLADVAPISKDPDLLTEHVRQNLSRQITRQYQTPDGMLPLITMNQDLENQIAAAIQDSGQGAYLGLNPNMAQAIINGIDGMIEQFTINNYQPLLLCSPLIRPHVKKLVERFIPNLVVLSHNEVAQDVRIEALGVVELSS
ncbi:MAG: flagellar biosynthesis protein FlhA [SAR324 cluster bacterium]|nr:flagellar biosynthesis protein FlhA [SAR324 cluster bacterium]MBL7035797.1 flagellar biosynthesis protein FlhA [SAR324 cluster bacterium]